MYGSSRMSAFRTIYELTSALFSDIVRYLMQFPDHKVATLDLHRHMLDLKERFPDKYRGLNFNRSIPYSYELEYIVNNLVRKGLMRQSEGYLRLTNFAVRTLSDR